MGHIPESETNILRTAERKQLHRLICEMQEDFNLEQLMDAAARVGIKMSRTGILNFILTLSYHKYLEPYKLKTSTSRGRAKILYKRLAALYKLDA